MPTSRKPRLSPLAGAHLASFKGPKTSTGNVQTFLLRDPAKAF